MTAAEILSNAYVVTGDSVRLEQMRRAFDACGLPAPKLWASCVIASDGSLGNAVSQYSLVRHALAEDLPWLVVFEDDAMPSDNAAAELERAFADKPADALCLSLGWSADSDPSPGEFTERGSHARVYGSHAYILFGEYAYLAYMSVWQKNGRADIVLGNMPGSYMNRESIFAQHSPGPGLHCRSGWSVDADAERYADEKIAARFTKSREVANRLRAERALHVAYTVDIQGDGAAQFVDQLCVSIHSLKTACAKAADEVVCHVFYGNAPVELVRRLHCLQTQFFHIDLRNISKREMARLQRYAKDAPGGHIRVWGGIVYARLFLAVALPNVKRCLYLDADTLVRRSPRPLIEMDLGGKPLAMNMGVVPEFGRNSGVIVWDLDAIRSEDGLFERLDSFLLKEGPTFKLPDQTAINRFFEGRIAEFGREWNFPPAHGVKDPAMKEAAILHYYNGGTKPQRIPDDDAGDSFIEWTDALADMEGTPL